MRKPGCSRMRASRCRSSTAWSSAARRRRSPTGTSSCRATTTPRGSRADSFDQAVRIGVEGDASLTPEMEERGHPPADLGRPHDVNTSPSICWIRSSAAPRSARASSARRSRSRSTGRSTSRSSPNGRGIPAQGPIPPGIFGFREGEAGLNRIVYDWVNGELSAKTDRSGEEATRRGRLPGRPRREDRAAARPLLRHDQSRTGRQAAARLVPQAVREALDPARDPRHRLEPVPGEGAQGHRSDLRLGLERRLPGSRELPVPAFTARRAAPSSRARTRRTMPTPSTTALFERMKNMPNGPARQALIDRMVEILRADAPWVVRASTRRLRPAHDWVAQPQAEPDGEERHQVPPRSTRPRARSSVRPGTSRCSGRSHSRSQCWFSVAVPALVSYRRRERAAARPA